MVCIESWKHGISVIYHTGSLLLNMLVSTHFGQLYPTRYLRDVWDQKLSHWCGEVAYDLGRIELLQLGDEAQKVC